MAESTRDISGLGLAELKALVVQALEDNARFKAENAALREDTYTYTAEVVATGGPCPPVTNILGTVTVNVPTNDPDVLLNVDFGGARSRKTGFAVIGNWSADYWNSCSITGRVSGALSNLLTARGWTSPVGLLVTNLPTAGTNGSSDAMYNNYLSTNSRAATVTITNLPSGAWTVYLYANDGDFTLSAGGNSYGTQELLRYAGVNAVSLAAGGAICGVPQRRHHQRTADDRDGQPRQQRRGDDLRPANRLR